MSINIQSTSDVADERGIKVLVHGQSGAGKTYMASTTTNLDETLIISAEQGLLSLHEYDIDAVEVTTIDEFRQARDFAQRQNRYSWIILDSISEIAEVILGEEKEQRRDPRQAYGEMADQVTAILRDFRHLPCNVVMTAKQTLEEVNGTKLKRPLLPGNQLTENVAYMFDEVFALELDRTRDGTNRRYLQTHRTRDIIAKDRSGALDPQEPADLSTIYEKITGEVGGEATGANGLPAGIPDARTYHDWDAADLSDRNATTGDDWQSEHSRFFALLDEADVNDPTASRLRDAIKARHGLDPNDGDAWKRLPAGCLKLWNDAIEAENGGRRDWAEAFVDAHEPVLPDTDAAAE
jgi:hypothetical protein